MTVVLLIILLIIGFVCDTASAFTSAFSKRWGKSRGSFITFILRNVLGIPVWVLGFLLAVRMHAKLFYEPALMVRIFGWLMLAVGGAIILMALVSIRTRAAAPAVGDHLVQTGLYNRVRHPIHLGTLLEFAGILVLVPKPAVAIACALGVVWVMVQTMCEEQDLLQRIPEYREYMKQVPRFMPRLGIKR